MNSKIPTGRGHGSRRYNKPHLADFDVLQNAAQLGAEYVISGARFHQSLNIENHNFLHLCTTCDLPAPSMSEEHGKVRDGNRCKAGKMGCLDHHVRSHYRASIAAVSLRRHPFKSKMHVER